MPSRTSYNPEVAPNPAAWLAKSERERMRSVSMHHMVNRLNSGNAKAHAAIHVIVENQVAMGLGATVRAMARLQSQGLSRHDSLHAIGSVLATHMFETVREAQDLDPETFQARIDAAIERLDAQTWLKEYGA